MFGLTTVSDADARVNQEREARVKAEAAANALRTQVGFLRTELARLQTHFDSQQQLFLEHLSPAPVKEVTPAAAATETPRQLTADQIMAEPAVTKREMALRARRAAEARLRDLGDQVRRDMDERMKLLSQTEREEMGFDPMLGIVTEKQPATVVPEEPTSDAEAA